MEEINLGKNSCYSLSVVVPVYNEQEILESTMLKLKQYLDSLNLLSYELILSENGSTDKSRDICNKLKDDYKGIVTSVFCDTPSFGEAIRKGIGIAKYENVVVYPADLTFSLDFIPRSLSLIHDYNIVYGSRYSKKSIQKRSFIRVLISKVHTKLINTLYRTNFSDIDSLKMYKTTYAKQILRKTNAHGPFIEVEIGVIVKNSGIKYAEIPINHIEEKTRHFWYILKSVIIGFYDILINYPRLRKIRIT